MRLLAFIGRKQDCTGQDRGALFFLNMLHGFRHFREESFISFRAQHRIHKT